MGTSGGLRGADVMQGLLRAPQQFDFSQAMELLEASDPQGAVFGQGLEKRVRLLPDDNLVFPASDIRGCQQQSPQLTLLMGFFGLYGVDAPVPHYLLDRTTAEDDDATRMRDFLNIFGLASLDDLPDVQGLVREASWKPASPPEVEQEPEIATEQAVTETE